MPVWYIEGGVILPRSHDVACLSDLDSPPKLTAMKQKSRNPETPEAVWGRCALAQRLAPRSHKVQTAGAK